MEIFRRALEMSGLSYLGWCGYKFTWSNGHEDESFVKERLDRAIANHGWASRFQDMNVEAIATWVSDHKSLVLTANRNVQRYFKKMNFKYEMSWDMKEECGKIIEVERGKTSGVNEPQKKLQRDLAGCRNSLSRWCRNYVLRRDGEIKELSEKIKIIEEEEGPENICELKRLKGELNVLLEQEDLRWKQRAKKHWLTYGDRNTKFYHACANQRKKKNTIKAIMTLKGGWWRKRWR
ncbi:uncharacterized protein LOC121240798 [Juglans microcarpa x Juglans regia]|uniref:uncharacterized protein LOC121240798 n=1 Tax=Juglans microcarpa x Juglans regia TaxID=2249226 RepID=UPI001B7F2F27|nr:uncharacterized protein LOC121240798 [Juglans microcarpa x Juglans regia]